MDCSRATFAIYSAELCGKSSELDGKNIINLLILSESTAYNERAFSPEKSERPEKAVLGIMTTLSFRHYISFVDFQVF